jgi:hypothetical protein
MAIDTLARYPLDVNCICECVSFLNLPLFLDVYYASYAGFCISCHSITMHTFYELHHLKGPY